MWYEYEVIMKKQIYLRIFAIIILALILSFILVFPKLGILLVEGDNHAKTDAAILLMGSVADRVLQASDLYLSGRVKKIIIAESFMDGHEYLIDRGAQVIGDAQRSEDLAIQLGVSKDDIIVLAGEAKSTQDEAYIIRDFLRDTDIKSVTVVTSSYHSKRSRMIFSKALEAFDITVYASPSIYDSFNPQKWWKDREDMKKVITECLKFANYFLREQFMF